MNLKFHTSKMLALKFLVGIIIVSFSFIALFLESKDWLDLVGMIILGFFVSIFTLVSLAILFKKFQSVEITDTHFIFYPLPYKEPVAWEWDEIRYLTTSNSKFFKKYLLRNETGKYIWLHDFRDPLMVNEIIKRSRNIKVQSQLSNLQLDF